MKRPRWEVADILKISLNQYVNHKHLPQHVKQAAFDIIRCRTQYLGGHKLRCDQCGYQSISYNSCRNRHCPKCQYSKREQWILNREADLLPVKYFHVVFTIPAELNRLAKTNPATLYNILFQAAWYTVKTLAADPHWLGGKTGMIALLHTWGQNLSLHPHLHCLIPNGAFVPEMNHWIFPRSWRFLFPVRVMSKMFRGKFMSLLQEAFLNKSICWKSNAWMTLKDQIKNAPFNVYAKIPFGGPDQVIQYLGRYSHRVAITNSRITHMDSQSVSFTYKDYRDGKTKVMELSPLQFTHRFLQHVLPKGFAKIRHFGIYANRCKNQYLQQILLFFEQRRKSPKTFSPVIHLKELYQIDLETCPVCKKGKMVLWALCAPIRGDPFNPIPILPVSTISPINF